MNIASVRDISEWVGEISGDLHGQAFKSGLACNTLGSGRATQDALKQLLSTTNHPTDATEHNDDDRKYSVPIHETTVGPRTFSRVMFQ